MLNTKLSHRSSSNNSGNLMLPIALPAPPGLSHKPVNVTPLPRSPRALELTLQTAERLLEHVLSLDEALASVAYLLATKLPVAYCRLLLVGEDGLSLIPRAAHTALADLQWKPQLNQPLPLALLPDGPRLSRLSYSLVGPHREPLLKEQLRHYSTALDLHEPLENLLLVPLKIGGCLLAVLELGELAGDGATGLSENEVQAIILQAPRLAAPLDERLR